LTQAQLALDPLARRRRTGAMLGIAAGAVLGSLLLHLAGFGSTLIMGRLDSHQKDSFAQAVQVTVREPPPPPPKVEEVLPEPADVPEPQPEKPKPKPKLVRELPPEPEPKPSPEGTPPPRIVGLSLDSTAEGGDGPSFAVGNTRAGTTGKRAADPKNVVAGAVGPIVEQPTVNQVATRLPVAGVVRVDSKQKQLVKPIFPETLKSQGIEAIVKVMVKIDAAGKVTEAKVIKAAPYPEFNEAALAAARKQEWEPETKDGVPIASAKTYEYKFFLEEGQ